MDKSQLQLQILQLSELQNICNDIIEIEYFWNNYRNPNIKGKTIKQK